MRRPPKRRLSRLGRPGDNRRGGHRHVILVSVGIGIYLAALCLGIVVIGDTALRSALMAALIVAIAAAGYIFTRQTPNR